MVGFLPDDLENYISTHSESGGDVEKELRKETLGLGPSSGMMSGDSVGNFLKFIEHDGGPYIFIYIAFFTIH